MRSALAAMVLLVGAAAPAVAAEPVTLTVIPQGPLLSIDPIARPDYATVDHGYMVYDTLFALDAELRAQPQMVESHLVDEDGLTHSIALRPGQRWHDGTEVTAEDCIASIKRWAEVDPLGRDLMARVRTIEPTGGASFTIALERPFPLLAEALARPTGTVPFMMPARLAATPPTRAIEDATGSGPFRLARRNPDSLFRTLYEKNDHYLPRNEPASLFAGGKRVLVDRVEWLYIPDLATAVFQLNAGRVEYWDLMPPTAPVRVSRNPDVEVRARDPYGQVGLLRLNHRAKPFDDPRARRAVALAVDRQAIAGAVAPFVADSWPCAAALGCGPADGRVVARDSNAAPDRREAARRLLRDAGYDGAPVVLLTPSDQPLLDAMVQTVAAQLRLVGFAVRIEAMLWQDLAMRRQSRAAPDGGGWNGFVTRWPALDLWSPGWSLALRANGDQAWYGWPEDSRLERLRQEWIDADTAEHREALRHDIERQAAESVPFVPLAQFRLPRGRRTTLSEPPATPAMVLWGIAKR